CWTARRLTGAGVRAQAGWAARAVRQASASVAASPSQTSATTSSRSAGLVEATRRARSTGRPAISDATRCVTRSVVPISRSAYCKPAALDHGPGQVDPVVVGEVHLAPALQDHHVRPQPGPEPSAAIL